MNINVMTRKIRKKKDSNLENFYTANDDRFMTVAKTFHQYIYIFYPCAAVSLREGTARLINSNVMANSVVI